MKPISPLFIAALFLMPSLALAAPAPATDADIADVRLDHAGWDSGLTKSPTGLGASYDEEDVTGETDMERPSLQISDDSDAPRETGVLFGTASMTANHGQ